MSYTPFDQDFDSFFDFDNGFHSQVDPISPSSLSVSATMDPSQSMFSGEPSERRQVYSGPSHEYSRHRQLTGLPTGSMAAVPMIPEIKMEDSYNMMPSSSNQAMPFMDFNSTNNFNFDGEIDPIQPAFFYPGNDPSFFHQDIIARPMVQMQEPNALVAQQQGRLWPGMHSQQAEQARVEAGARQQKQQKLGQEIMQQKHMHKPSASLSVPSMPTTRANSVASVDPAVDDRISRLLDQMRHNSTVSTIDEEDESAEGESSRMNRSRKDEDEMDEDERLLASEEGKKLSSKERRQLRNKVSARAFRSRRKEYITQLEGEVASKTQECEQIKAKNRHMAEQVAQLTQLTRSLLAHPAFATFAEDLSNDPSSLAQSTGSTSSGSSSATTRQTNSFQTSSDRSMNSQSQQQPEQQQQSQQQQQQQQQGGMQRNSSLDLSMLNLGNNHWNASATNFNNFQQPQVFAVFELPQPAEFSSQALSGKDDALNQILSPLKLSLPSVSVKAQVPRLSTVMTNDEAGSVATLSPSMPAADSCTFTTASGRSVPSRSPSTGCSIEEINAVFDAFDMQLKQLQKMTGQSGCHE